MKRKREKESERKSSFVYVLNVIDFRMHGMELNHTMSTIKCSCICICTYVYVFRTIIIQLMYVQFRAQIACISSALWFIARLQCAIFLFTCFCCGDGCGHHCWWCCHRRHVVLFFNFQWMSRAQFFLFSSMVYFHAVCYTLFARVTVIILDRRKKERKREKTRKWGK